MHVLCGSSLSTTKWAKHVLVVRPGISVDMVFVLSHELKSAEVGSGAAPLCVCSLLVFGNAPARDMSLKGDTASQQGRLETICNRQALAGSSNIDLR